MEKRGIVRNGAKERVKGRERVSLPGVRWIERDEREWRDGKRAAEGRQGGRITRGAGAILQTRTAIL